MFKPVRQFFSWIFRRQTTFEKTFSGLNYVAKYGRDANAQKTYELLQTLRAESPTELTHELAAAFLNIRYSSNTDGVFRFALPIVSHILYFKPEMTPQLLKSIVGPVFANGETSVDGLIRYVQNAMEYQLQQHPNFLTPESQHWIKHTLPDLRAAIQQAIDDCWQEIN